mmetsp:Transcript_20665/g.50040  ORF Transcript_20665/g.50040 Transcript_20665/m.50040 type:complete len:351 (+) Transcript_20665:421-1473(+)
MCASLRYFSSSLEGSLMALSDCPSSACPENALSNWATYSSWDFLKVTSRSSRRRSLSTMSWPSSRKRRSACSASSFETSVARSCAISSCSAFSVARRFSSSERFRFSIASSFSGSACFSRMSSASMARSRSSALSFAVSASFTSSSVWPRWTLSAARSTSVLPTCSPRTERRSRRASARDSSALSAASSDLFSCSRRMTAVSSLRRLSSASSLKRRVSSVTFAICASSSSSRTLYRMLSSLRPSCSWRSAASQRTRSCSSFSLSSSMYAAPLRASSSRRRISSSIPTFFSSVSFFACSMVVRASSASRSICMRRSLSEWIFARCASLFATRASMISRLRTISITAAVSSR